MVFSRAFLHEQIESLPKWADGESHEVLLLWGGGQFPFQQLAMVWTFLSRLMTVLRRTFCRSLGPLAEGPPVPGLGRLAFSFAAPAARVPCGGGRRRGVSMLLSHRPFAHSLAESEPSVLASGRHRPLLRPLSPGDGSFRPRGAGVAVEDLPDALSIPDGSSRRMAARLAVRP